MSTDDDYVPSESDSRSDSEGQSQKTTATQTTSMKSQTASKMQQTRSITTPTTGSMRRELPESTTPKKLKPQTRNKEYEERMARTGGNVVEEKQRRVVAKEMAVDKEKEKVKKSKKKVQEMRVQIDKEQHTQSQTDEAIMNASLGIEKAPQLPTTKDSRFLKEFRYISPTDGSEPQPPVKPSPPADDSKTYNEDEARYIVHH